MTDEVYKHYFPVGDSQLVVGVQARRDGAPIAWNGKVPILAKYVVLDEFGTPVLDPSLCWFNTGEEALLVAEVYLQLLKEGHPCADRFFSDSYAMYARLKDRLASFVWSWKTANGDPVQRAAKKDRAVKQFLLDM
jgi:hypothetical protein